MSTILICSKVIGREVPCYSNNKKQRKNVETVVHSCSQEHSIRGPKRSKVREDIISLKMLNKSIKETLKVAKSTLCYIFKKNECTATSKDLKNHRRQLKYVIAELFPCLRKKKYNIVKDTFINVQKDYNKVQTTGYTQQQEGPNPTCRQNKDYSDEEKHRPNRITSSVKHGGGNVVLCYGHLWLSAETGHSCLLML